MVDGFRQTKNDSDVLMIDIGGGMGQDIQRFKQKYPDVGGRLILQDLPRTVANAVVSEGIETMGYDFFTPQPVKGQDGTSPLPLSTPSALHPQAHMRLCSICDF